jgi:hypothetical protein
MHIYQGLFGNASDTLNNGGKLSVGEMFLGTTLQSFRVLFDVKIGC